MSKNTDSGLEVKEKTAIFVTLLNVFKSIQSGVPVPLQNLTSQLESNDSARLILIAQL